MLQDFKTFLLRGNVVELAVGVVMGVAFGTVVSSFVRNLLTPLIAIPGRVDFGGLSFKIGGGIFRYGQFLNDLIAFLMTATAIFFVVVRPMATLMSLQKSRAAAVAPTTKECPFCLSTIPLAATRCAFCTSEQK